MGVPIHERLYKQKTIAQKLGASREVSKEKKPQNKKQWKHVNNYQTLTRDMRSPANNKSLYQNDENILSTLSDTGM